MDEQKPPSEDKDSETAGERGVPRRAPWGALSPGVRQPLVPAADGTASSEEAGGTEGDPLKPPEGASAGPELEPERTGTEEPPQAGSAPARRCALCNCGAWSPHGQQELQRFDPPPDWPPWPAVPKPTETPHEPLPPPDDLAPIGFAEPVVPAQLFEPTGHCWVHRCCAAWSAGVLPGAAGLAHVDRAVFSGISQKCEHCQRMGATIPCCADGCPRLYHFPCAAASGCFQSMKTLRLLCPEHMVKAAQTGDARCVVCDGPGDLRDLLFC
ncbi:KMT2D methyltransferase, partial [Nothocercus julius]|nr:KMT2D methyltransferase [Nothocercus julius]